MWLIVGLGNPGSRYLLTRHNVGFSAIDYLAKAVGVRNEDARAEHNALTIHFKWDTEPVILAKPQTFMNLSGDSISALMHYYKVESQHVIVLHDELDLPFQSVRIKARGGDGGHNGLKSLIEKLGTNEFLRIRIGIGRPPHPEIKPADFVLQNFSKTEQPQLPDILNETVDMIEAIVFDGPVKAMNQFNARNKDEE